MFLSHSVVTSFTFFSLLMTSCRHLRASFLKTTHCTEGKGSLKWHLGTQTIASHCFSAYECQTWNSRSSNGKFSPLKYVSIPPEKILLKKTEIFGIGPGGSLKNTLGCVSAVQKEHSRIHLKALGGTTGSRLLGSFCPRGGRRCVGQD